MCFGKIANNLIFWTIWGRKNINLFMFWHFDVLLISLSTAHCAQESPSSSSAIRTLSFPRWAAGVTHQVPTNAPENDGNKSMWQNGQSGPFSDVKNDNHNWKIRLYILTTAENHIEIKGWTIFLKIAFIILDFFGFRNISSSIIISPNLTESGCLIETHSVQN